LFCILTPLVRIWNGNPGTGRTNKFSIKTHSCFGEALFLMPLRGIWMRPLE
jgi:hypothetical protein